MSALHDLTPVTAETPISVIQPVLETLNREEEYNLDFQRVWNAQVWD
jgi:hypothetical protein